MGATAARVNKNTNTNGTKNLRNGAPIVGQIPITSLYSILMTDADSVKESPSVPLTPLLHYWLCDDP